jgi:hypothetical protein
MIYLIEYSHGIEENLTALVESDDEISAAKILKHNKELKFGDEIKILDYWYEIITDKLEG